MASLPAYVNQMWDRQKVIARKLGVDITTSDKTIRVVNKSLLVLLAVVVKTLVDKSLITDAELLATMDAARDAVWPDEPIQPAPDP